MEVSYIDVWKFDLNEQKDFEKLVLLGIMSPRETNDIMQNPKKEVHFFFFSNLCIVFNCSWQLMFDKKQKTCVKLIHLITDDGLYDRKAFYKVRIVFIFPQKLYKSCKKDIYTPMRRNVWGPNLDFARNSRGKIFPGWSSPEEDFPDTRLMTENSDLVSYKNSSSLSQNDCPVSRYTIQRFTI